MSRKHKRKNKTEYVFEKTENMIKYTEFILQNQEDLCDIINDRVFELEDEIREKIFDSIRKILLSKAKHYELEYDSCTYDYSGVLVENGKIDLNQTVTEFLENEYTGQWMPSYTSGYGKSYETYDDALSYDTLEMGEKIMDEVLKEEIFDEFGCEVDEGEWFNMRDDYHDEIYSNCVISDFFTCIGTLGILGGGDIMLKDLIKDAKEEG